MCTTCGCSDGSVATVKNLATGEPGAIGTRANTHHHAHGHDHAHDHGHGHSHDHSHDHVQEHLHDHAHDDLVGHAHRRSHDRAPGADASSAHAKTHATTVALEHAVLARNDRLAERNRGWLEARGIVALNLLSSPGSGKTTLLERTIRGLGAEIPMSVVEGDQATEFDAERIRAAGCATVQVNTGTGCHLEADTVGHALRSLDPANGALVMIENVGNLVCPALFDLGEGAKVVILSVTEGDDKPLKYPHMFRAARLMVVNKIDLLPYVAFDVANCVANARRVNPGIEVLEVSATTGEGLEAWFAWLRARIRAGTRAAEAR